ncbi:MAG TPA: thioredoxin family protein [Pirellulales bacterium]|nr:thioredoxin family protein [Pirellulales bacterium]
MISLTLTSLVQLAVLATPTTAQTYDEAYRNAAETGRPLVILVGAEWCPACQQMKQVVMPQLARDGELNKCAFATVNTDADSTLAGKLMSGGSIPQLMIYRKAADGSWKRQLFIGAQSPSTIAAAIQYAAKEALDNPVKLTSGE